jgi:SAM-dependent methyltransferase
MAEAVVPELPGEGLRVRVAGHTDADWFWRSGGLSIAHIGKMLSIVGRSFADYPRALEFGCGCGRILLHMEDIAQRTELHGVDIDPKAIGWLRQHVPWVSSSVNDALPPLPFPDGHFDLVFNHSVFTHLDERYQDAWLQELVRVTRPGGTVLLSVSGEHAFGEFTRALRDSGADPAKFVRLFRSRGIVFIEDDYSIGEPFPDFYHSTFHAPWYVFEHWGRFFEIEAFVPRGALDFQDYVLLRRREGPSPIRPPEPRRVGDAVARSADEVRRQARRLYRRWRARPSR